MENSCYSRDVVKVYESAVLESPAIQKRRLLRHDLRLKLQPALGCLPNPVNITTFKQDINEEPTVFLQKIYSAKTMQDVYDIIENLKNNQDLLKKCKEILINQYSVFSALILAPDLSLDQKRTGSQSLLELGFKPTEKDRAIAWLEYYDRTPHISHRNLMLARGWSDDNCILSIVPLEILMAIVKKIKEKEQPLIPLYNK